MKEIQQPWKIILSKYGSNALYVQGVKDLHKSFEEAVDDYIARCKKAGKELLKPAKGSFNIRISPELHRKAIHTSKQMHLNLNQFVQQAIEQAVAAH